MSRPSPRLGRGRVIQSSRLLVPIVAPRSPSCSSTCSSCRGSSTSRSRDGHLYGSLVDILRNSAPTVVLAIGMTLVIATGGVDLSVGAVMAISASVACILIDPRIIGLSLAGEHHRRRR